MFFPSLEKENGNESHSPIYIRTKRKATGHLETREKSTSANSGYAALRTLIFEFLTGEGCGIAQI